MDILATAYGRQRNLLWLNRRDGTFRDVGLASGFAGDEDTSGAYSAETKRYFKERYGQERKDEPPFGATATPSTPRWATSTATATDVLLAEITHSWAGPSSDHSALLENITERQGVTPPKFRRHPEAVARPHEGPNWEPGRPGPGCSTPTATGSSTSSSASGDYPDTNRLRLFRQTSPLVFEDVTDAAGITLDNSAQISLCDYDRDGDVDILTGRTNMRLPADRQRPLRPYLYENRSPPRHWLHVRLRGLGRSGAAPTARGSGPRSWPSSRGWPDGPAPGAGGPRPRRPQRALRGVARAGRRVGREAAHDPLARARGPDLGLRGRARRPGLARRRGGQRRRPPGLPRARLEPVELALERAPEVGPGGVDRGVAVALRAPVELGQDHPLHVAQGLEPGAGVGGLAELAAEAGEEALRRLLGQELARGVGLPLARLVVGVGVEVDVAQEAQRGGRLPAVDRPGRGRAARAARGAPTPPASARTARRARPAPS